METINWTVANATDENAARLDQTQHRELMLLRAIEAAVPSVTHPVAESQHILDKMHSASRHFQLDNFYFIN